MSCSSQTVVIRQGDRFPYLSLPVTVGCEETFDPADYEDWMLLMVGPATITGGMTYDEDAEVAVYEWVAGSTAVPGRYFAMVQATHSASGLTRTFPASGSTEVIITALPA